MTPVSGSGRRNSLPAGEIDPSLDGGNNPSETVSYPVEVNHASSSVSASWRLGSWLLFELEQLPPLVRGPNAVCELWYTALAGGAAWAVVGKELLETRSEIDSSTVRSAKSTRETRTGVRRVAMKSEPTATLGAVQSASG